MMHVSESLSGDIDEEGAKEGDFPSGAILLIIIILMFLIIAPSILRVMMVPQRTFGTIHCRQSPGARSRQIGPLAFMAMIGAKLAYPEYRCRGIIVVGD